MLLHLEEVGRQIELYGVDIDADAISWAQEHIPWARCSTVEGLPPLPFPDKFFDLIYNHSVLTHLDDKYQDAWLSELRRIVKPSGMVVLTVHGDFAFNKHEKEWRKQGLDPEIWIDTFRRKGFLYITEDNWTKTFPDFYHTAFHAPSYVFEHWSRLMDIRAYVPRGALNFQDLILLQRREYDKGARAIAELEEELTAAKARLASSEKVLADIHASWTWKIARAITSPLRLIR
jgi:SAM-dependent methyltransferase